MLKSNFLKKLGLCVLSAALCASAFASCGKDGDGDGDNGKKIDENTNIFDVASEKVADETAWKAAFDVTKFTNFSMKTVSKQTVAAKTLQNALTFLYTGDKAYYAVSEPKDEKIEKNEVYFSKTNDVWSAYGMVYSGSELTFEGAYDVKNHPEYDMMTSGSVGTMMLTQLGEVPFAEVSYSEEKKGYIYSKDGAEAVLKIADGLFAGYAMSGESGEGESKMSMEMSAIYYNIGSTEITLPEKMTMPAAEETMTKADFYAEVKKREDASIAAKKWGTVNVSGTQTKNGVTANDVYANNAPISHGMGFSMVKLTVSESETSVSSTNVGVFGYSVMQKNTVTFSTEEFKKVGANLQAVWVATEGGETDSVKTTLNEDGYLTEYEMKSETATETVEQKLTFSGYAGEYNSGKKPGGDSGNQPGDSDTPAEKEFTVSDFLDKIAQLQEKADAYTKVSVGTQEETYRNLDITDGEAVCGEGENALHLPIGVKKIEEMIKSMEMLKAKVSVKVSSVGNREFYDLMFEVSNNTIITYIFGSDGYLCECKKSVDNEGTTVAKLFNYQK